MTLSPEAQFLKDLVSIPSLSGEEQQIAEFLRDYAAEHALSAEIDGAGNFVATLGEGDQDLLMLGHMDVVPDGPAVEIRDNQLYGRGSVDAKGPLATFVQAAIALKSEAEILKNWRIVVIGAVEEEVASSKGAHFLKDKYAPEYCIIGEPSAWNAITLGYKGCLRFEFAYSEIPQHTAGPGFGVADTAIQAWQRLKNYCEAFNEGKERVFDQLQVRLIDFQTSTDGQHDWARGRLNMRLPIDIDTDALKKFLETNFDDAAEATLFGLEQAYLTSRRTPLTPVFKQAVTAQGGQFTFKQKTGTSDMNVVGPVWQCPIIAYGPGDSTLDHTPHEHVDLDEYQKAIVVLTEAMKTLLMK